MFSMASAQLERRLVQEMLLSALALQRLWGVFFLPSRCLPFKICRVHQRLCLTAIAASGAPQPAPAPASGDAPPASDMLQASPSRPDTCDTDTPTAPPPATAAEHAEPAADAPANGPAPVRAAGQPSTSGPIIQLELFFAAPLCAQVCDSISTVAISTASVTLLVLSISTSLYACATLACYLTPDQACGRHLLLSYGCCCYSVDKPAHH